MAIQVLQQPPQIAFVGDPVVVKAKTTLTGKTFLRIKITVNAQAHADAEYYDYSEEYSYEVGSDGIAAFNISETLKAALYSRMTYDVGEDGSITQKAYAVRYRITYKETYLEDMVETEAGETTSENYEAITGSLTEFERMTASNADTTTLLGSGRILSRKPDGDIVPIGRKLLVPLVNVNSDTTSYTVKQGTDTQSYSKYTRGELVPASLEINTSSLQEGELVVSASFETGIKRYVVKENPLMRHFIFLNGFGLMESVTAYTRDALEYDIESNLYTPPSEISFRSTTRTANYAQPPVATFSMSSGYVSREWAEWWLTEFVVTRKAWMYENGKFIPVSILPEETNDLYDRSKPGLLAVNFSVRCSFAGSTYNSFIR